MIRSNLRYAIKEAAKYKYDGLDYEDQVSIAISGLINGLNHFKPEIASLPESKSQSPEDKAIYACFKESFYKNVKKIPVIERTVFLMNNGFCGYSKKSLAEIGKLFGKTKQWAWYKSQAAERIMAEWMAEWVA